jgi:hypothetical protein
MKPDLRTLLGHPAISEEPRTGKKQDKALQSVAVRRIIQRVREVITRRDLAIPLTGSQTAVDPNTIAEYLDGVLPPDRTAEIEELCLAVDKYLAEVAGCQQVLPKTSESRLGRDAEVWPQKGGERPSPAVFRRMYGLLAGAAPFASSKSARLWKPQHRRRWAIAGSVLLALLFLGALFMTKFRLTNEDRMPESEDAADSSLTFKESPHHEDHERPSGPVKVLSPSQLGKVAMAEGASKGLLWRQTLSKEKMWRVAPPDATISTDDQLLALPGFQSEIQLDNGVRLRLLGNLPPLPIPEEGGMDGMGNPPILESAVTLRSNPGMDLVLQLSRGRITVTNNKPQGEARVRIGFADETWNLTLAAPGSEAALELRQYYPPGFGTESEAEAPTAEAHLFALHGEMHLQIRYDSYLLREPPGPAEFSWNNVGAVSRHPQELQQLPVWTNSPALSKDLREALTSFQTRLASHTQSSKESGGKDQESGANQPDAVASLLKETLNQPEGASRVLAVYGLGAIDKLPEVLKLLGDEKQFPEARRAAIISLRHWMSGDAENDRKLLEAVKKTYSSSTAEIVLHLLHGFSPAQLQQPAVYASLIGYLQHADLPVRELANTHLLILVPEGKAISYDPAGDITQRRRSVEEWKKLIPEGAVPKR